MPDPIRSKKLSTGHIALYNVASKEMILVEPASVPAIAACPDPTSAWTAAQKLVPSGNALHLSTKALGAVHESTAAVVLLSGSGGWPPSGGGTT